MTTSQPFVHLHVHTAYSLLDGACRIPALIKRTRDLDMTAVSMTDHGVLYGAIEFYKAAKAEGIKPIMGCEIYVATGDMQDRSKDQDEPAGHHLVLLAENDAGYANLMKLVSLAHLNGYYYKPRVDRATLAQHHLGLICLSACLKGELAQSCSSGNTERARRAAGEYRELFGKDNFFIEIQDHGLPEQRAAQRGLLDISKAIGTPLVATNDVHYLERADARAHEIMLCLQTGTVLSDPQHMRYGSEEFYLKSADEMAALFKDLPQALQQTVAIAERCNVQLDVGAETLHFPTYDVPAGMTQKKHLLQLGYEGLQDRYDIKDPAHPQGQREQDILRRFQYELGIIDKTGFINYFLVVADFVRFAREHHIPVGPGRGSGAGSIVAYALGITGIDPLHYGLIFERFLNPQRVSPPDFDIDFCQTRRGEVIEYVKEKYGRDNVAQIITFGRLGAKTVIRDVGRVLEIPLVECDRLAKLVPEDPGASIEGALRDQAEFRAAVSASEPAREILKYARLLEGLPRQTGLHAAGVVIGDRPLIEILPLARDKSGETVTQFEMKPLESTGLLKMDFLGLKTLTVIQETLDLLKETRTVDLDIEDLPLDDVPTFELLNRGDTIGVFQLESRGMRDLLRRIGLTCIEELIAMIALYRPGPMNMLDSYVERKHGRVPIRVEHPLLEPILKETYGVMLYQEQVQQAAQALAGFTLGEGDILRRAMGKKIPEEMAAQRERFVEGCRQTNRIPRDKANRIFDDIARFAGYGFNKSHSAAYGIISYQTAYLKAHYPAEFMAALLSSEIGNTDKLPLLIAEAQALDLSVLPPDVNESWVRFRPIEGRIRFGMAGVKNVGHGAMIEMVREREQGGPFKGLVDFCGRMSAQGVNRKMVESLVKCGAFDFTGYSRGQLFAGIDFALQRTAAQLRDQRSGQITLFDALAGDDAEDQTETLPEAPPWPARDMLLAEKELLGFYFSGHPLRDHEWLLDRYALVRLAKIGDLETGAVTRVGGLVTQLARKTTRKGQPMATFRLEGIEGEVQVVAFSDACERYGAVLAEEALVMVAGEYRCGDKQEILAQEIYPLEQAPRLFARRISLHLPHSSLDHDHLDRVKTLLRAHPGETPVHLCVVFSGGEKVFIHADAGYRVLISHTLMHALEQMLGEDSVFVEVIKEACLQPRRRRNWSRDS